VHTDTLGHTGLCPIFDWHVFVQKERRAQVRYSAFAGHNIGASELTIRAGCSHSLRHEANVVNLQNRRKLHVYNFTGHTDSGHHYMPHIPSVYMIASVG
jgi:hypothetical protein